MRRAVDDGFILTIADSDGWLFEHVIDAPTEAEAERQVRELLRFWGMTLIAVRRAPPVKEPSWFRPWYERADSALRARVRAVRARGASHAGQRGGDVRMSAASPRARRRGASSSGS